LQHILRYNEFQTDPLAQKNPNNAICSRGDLDPQHARPGGCYDSKATTSDLALNRIAYAVNGPTTQGQITFDWSKFDSYPHLGMPQLFNFGWVKMSPIE